MPLEHLGDIKANSIAEWVTMPAVQRAIQRHFKHFLMTWVDENGQSVYGQRIKQLGEGESGIIPWQDKRQFSLHSSQLRIFGSLISSPGNFEAYSRILLGKFPAANAGDFR